MNIEIFNSFEEENNAEDRRRALMSPDERVAEFNEIQKRVWGTNWKTETIVKCASWEKVTW